MPKAVWFLLGFVLALGLIVAVFAGPTLMGRASAVPSSGETPTLAPIAYEPAPASTPLVPKLGETGLRWLRQGEQSGQCARLEIDGRHQAHYGPCEEGTRLAYLTSAELNAYLALVARHASFEYAVQETSNGWMRATVQTQFMGRGARLPTVAEQDEVARWAAAVYARLRDEELRADLVAAARRQLAGRLALALDDVSVVEVQAVTWPDACLGLHAEGVFCAQVRTRGYRITLAVAERAYEYRTDERGAVRAVEGTPARLVLPPIAD